MFKYSILNPYLSIRAGFTMRWLVLCLLLPVALYVPLLLFESPIAELLRFLFPPTDVQGFTFYLDIVYLVRTEILWWGFFSFLASLFIVYASDGALGEFLGGRIGEKAPFYVMMIVTVVFFASIFVSRDILERFPNSSDEYAYLFQAEMFSAGKLWERAHELPDLVYNNNIAQFEGIRLSRFPPGWPLILSQAFETGLDPSLVNPVLAVITLVVFYFFARRYYGDRVAVWALMIISFSAYYIFNAASYFSHISCVLATLLFVYNLRLYGENRNFLYGILAGFFLGVVLVIRYYTAVLIFLPFLPWLLMRYRLRVMRLFFLMFLGSMPCIAYLFWYNYSITGSPLLPVTVWAYPMEQLGFVKGHSMLKGFEHWVRWILLFFYWCSPGVLVLYFIFLWRKVKSSRRLFIPDDYIFLALFVGYFFYYQIGGNQYGPRFLFEAFPFLVLLVVRETLAKREKFSMALLAAGLIFSVVKSPFIAYREAEIVDQRQDMYDLVREANLENAVVLVTSATSAIRPMPADDLTRNDRLFSNDVIYALEVPQVVGQLMAYYPDRAFYRYVRHVDEENGRLVKLR